MRTQTRNYNAEAQDKVTLYNASYLIFFHVKCYEFMRLSPFYCRIFVSSTSKFSNHNDANVRDCRSFLIVGISLKKVLYIKNKFKFGIVSTHFVCDEQQVNN